MRGRSVVELRWEDFDRVTIEATLPRRESCAGDALTEGRARLTGACRSIDARVREPHPLVDFASDTRVRCVLAASGEPAAWCKLDYTGWFRLHTDGERATGLTPTP